VKDITENLTGSERKTVREILNLMVKCGLIKDGEIQDIDIQENTRNMQIKAYHQTRKLLESYREMKWAIESHTDGAIEDITDGKVNTTNVNFVMEKLFEKCDLRYDDDKRVKNFISSLDSASKSYKCLATIDKSLAKLRTKPKVGQLYYDILNVAYIEDNEEMDIPSVDEIAEKLSISRPVYFKKRDDALKQLSTLIWGVPQGEAGVWFEALLILSEERSQKKA
jgi:hypothetical protein